MDAADLKDAKHLTGQMHATATRSRASLPAGTVADGQSLDQRWLKSQSKEGAHDVNAEPSYWKSELRSLICSSNIHHVCLGTGESIYATSILPLIEAAEREVILVTCFWARSKTLQSLRAALLKLSVKGQQSSRRIRIRIYFSSSSLLQKLFHPQSLQGRMWDATTWKPKLGLPSQDELPGVELQVKSVFLLPFSVMHPKFVIIDRKRVLLPSCNVSWEDWFEGCVELSGGVVHQFVTFWQQFWATADDSKVEIEHSKGVEATGSSLTSTIKALSSKGVALEDVQTIFLPSPHHHNPRFAFLPWQSCPSPPPTPLNTFLLEAFKGAHKSIYVQTPNLTAPPILSALLAALRRGVDVTILTSEKLMILEQLVTAGSTTSRCMRKLIKRHRSLRQKGGRTSSDPRLLESGMRSDVGGLLVSYYQPLSTELREASTPEPVQSHLKLTIVDGEWTVLGSGNLDRASLFTSQELGVAFHSQTFATMMRGEVGKLTERRRKAIYEG